MATFEEYKKKNGDKAWKFQAYLGINPETGKPVKTTRRNFKTQREAKLALARLQSEYEDNLLKKEKPKTYKDVYDLWMTEYKRTVRGSTLLKTERIFKNHVLEELGDIYISEITPIKIQELMDKWANKYDTAPKMMNYTGLVFKYAVRFGIIESNPTDAIRKPKRRKKATVEEPFYDKNQLKLFLDELYNQPNLKIQAFFRLLAMTGMRKQEAGTLEWRDIDFKDKTVNIYKAVTRTANGLEIDTTKTVGSSRIISIDQGTLDKLNEWKKVALPPSDDWLIFGQTNAKNPHDIMSLDTSRKWLMSIQDKMDKKQKKKLPRITVHGFRHTQASLLIEMGASLKEVQFRLGHEDIQTTMNTYAHVSKLAKEQLADKFNKFIDF
ncbi:tyrosine-type recombinase/integrase [Enterococcus hirae]